MFYQIFVNGQLLEPHRFSLCQFQLTGNMWETCGNTWKTHRIPMVASGFSTTTITTLSAEKRVRNYSEFTRKRVA